MSDALCGPSNPLQQFKQQTSLDRTLQQDRLASRQSPVQGFRSPDPNVGLLDPEFEAFQAALPAPNLPQFHQPFHPQQQPAFAGGSQTPAWASDFQHMHISSPPPLQQHRVQQSGPATSNWAQGFREHIAQSAPRAQQTSSPSPLAFQQRARYGYNGFQSQLARDALAQPAYSPAMQQSKGKEAVHEQFDDAAFEAAFAQATDELMTEAKNTPMREYYDSHGNTIKEARPVWGENVSAEDVALRDELARNEHADMLREDIEALKILEDFAKEHTGGVVQEEQRGEEKSEEQVAREEEDALAATAQELLEKVQNNKTDKFQNSQFLGLMRKLRDREVKVEGDKMVDTAASAAATEGSSMLNATSTSYANDIPRFDNTEQRPSPLAASHTTTGARESIVDTRPPEYGYDDSDLGRVDPRDGQAVVDLLNERGPVSDDIGTSALPTSLPKEGMPPWYGDLRTMHGARDEQAASLSDMLYGHDGTLEGGINWAPAA